MRHAPSFATNRERSESATTTCHPHESATRTTDRDSDSACVPPSPSPGADSSTHPCSPATRFNGAAPVGSGRPPASQVVVALRLAMRFARGGRPDCRPAWSPGSRMFVTDCQRTGYRLRAVTGVFPSLDRSNGFRDTERGLPTLRDATGANRPRVASNSRFTLSGGRDWPVRLWSLRGGAASIWDRPRIRCIHLRGRRSVRGR